MRSGSDANVEGALAVCLCRGRGTLDWSKKGVALRPCTPWTCGTTTPNGCARPSSKRSRHAPNGDADPASVLPSTTSPGNVFSYPARSPCPLSSALVEEAPPDLSSRGVRAENTLPYIFPRLAGVAGDVSTGLGSDPEVMIDVAHILGRRMRDHGPR